MSRDLAGDCRQDRLRGAGPDGLPAAETARHLAARRHLRQDVLTRQRGSGIPGTGEDLL